MIGSGRLRVLVLVKAAPQPSRQYGDTVCVAGVTLDAESQWVRLYDIRCPSATWTESGSFGNTT